MTFLDCPAYLDEEGAARCGLPAEVRCRFIMRSTGGPLESAMICCPVGHSFNGPIESLTWQSGQEHESGRPSATSTTRRDSRTSSHAVPLGRSRRTVQAFRRQPAQDVSRPNTAPAYYLGRPARLWTIAMRPRSMAEDATGVRAGETPALTRVSPQRRIVLAERSP